MSAPRRTAGIDSSAARARAPMATGTASEAPRATSGIAEPKASAIDRRRHGEGHDRDLGGGQLGGAGEHGDAADPGERAEGQVAGDAAAVEDDRQGGRQRRAADQPGDGVAGLGDEAGHRDGAGHQGERREEPRPLLGEVGGPLVAARATVRPADGGLGEDRLPATPTAMSGRGRLEGHDRGPDGGEHRDGRAGPVAADTARPARATRVTASTAVVGGGRGDGRREAGRGGERRASNRPS